MITAPASANAPGATHASVDFKRYALVTAAYWGLTLTDGALRMLVLLHFHELGFTPLQLAFLFLLYEAMGVITNLVGGYTGARYGLKITLFLGLGTQIAALSMLSLVDPAWAVPLSVAHVMASQALAGVAKDLTKMSSKSAVKLVLPPLPPEVPREAPPAPEAAPEVSPAPELSSEAGTRRTDRDSQLFKWVAILTGSKNALKGVGFFLGGLLLTWLGFRGALWIMAGGIVGVLIAMLVYLKGDFGKSQQKTKFKQLFAKSKAINLLSLARVFLFGARDVWFVVALPIFLHHVLGWNFTQTGGFMALWVIGYGLVQAAAPKLFKSKDAASAANGALAWGMVLAASPAAIALGVHSGLPLAATVLIGLGVFGVLFAINSSVHSYLILALTDEDQVALNVGFYYMANAIGRLLGTLLSGLVYMAGGLTACLWVSAAMVLVAAVSLAPLRLDRRQQNPARCPA